MLNEKGAELLKKVIKEKYEDVKLENVNANENEFYYEFKVEASISEKDLKELEEKIKEMNNEIFVKLLRISGVYFEGNIENEMITRIVGKAFKTKHELEDYEKFLEEAKERDHRKIGKDLDLFCFLIFVFFGGKFALILFK